MTAGSLGHLFRSTGFDVIELVRDYGDQYIWIMAKPSKQPVSTSARLPIEDDLEATTAAVAHYRERCPKDITRWRERFREFAASGRKPVIWGAGSKAVSLVTTAGIGPYVDYLVDVNPFKAGKFLPGTGHAVMAPEHLALAPPEVLVAMNPLYVQEIRERLAAMGVTADVVAL
jgi:hypothetical protein